MGGVALVADLRAVLRWLIGCCSCSCRWWSRRSRSPSYRLLRTTEPEHETHSPRRPQPLAAAVRRRVVLLLTLVVLVLVLAAACFPWSAAVELLRPGPSPAPPLCAEPGAAYQQWLQRHARLRVALATDCASLWSDAAHYPRLLVHDCRGPRGCSGLGDRVAKVAGLFLFALMTDRALFLEHELPVMQTWYAPRSSDFDWTVEGSVRDCLDRARNRTQSQHSPGIHRGYWDAGYWGVHDGARGWLRKLLSPRSRGSAALLPPEPVLFVDGDTNTIRPLEIGSEFHADLAAGIGSGLLPFPLYSDDTMATLLQGCLLSHLWQETPQTAALVAPLLQRATPCLAAVHVRFGDVFMFHFNASTLEGTETDRHVEPRPAVVQQAMTCALSQAHALCTEGTAHGLSLFFTTDAPQYARWFEAALPALRAWDAERWQAAAFPSIALLKSQWEAPGNVVSFGVISADERRVAEQQLISDWSMLSRAHITVTTGSVFSYTAASYGLHFPIDANTCRVRWLG